jgi:SAM-dependent MidA family methyltransferase
VETSAPLVAQQRSRLSRFGERIRWHADVADALRACGGEADIFSNELVDAFPAISLRWDSSRGVWDEAMVKADGMEAWRPSDFSCEWQAADGQRIERHPSYQRWLAAWAPEWKAGRMLTIDYGGTFPGMYWRKPAGTLRAYFSQQRLDGPGEFFQRAGYQDLTSDVNFSDLMRWGQELGLGEGHLRSQREFLIGALPKLEVRAQRDPALAFLLDPDGAGSAFQVLEHELPPS